MLKLDARKSGSFRIGGEIEVNRLGFGAMRLTGPGISTLSFSAALQASGTGRGGLGLCRKVEKKVQDRGECVRGSGASDDNASAIRERGKLHAKMRFRCRSHLASGNTVRGVRHGAV
jgi:hypothetical protein